MTGGEQEAVSFGPFRVVGAMAELTRVDGGEDVGGTYGSNWAVGDRVQVIAAVPCGECYECRKGWMAVCQNQTSMGYQYDGGFAEYMIVPRQVLKVDGLNRIPENVGFDEASAAEPFACAINAQELLGIEEGDTVVVLGAGPVGLVAAQSAWLMGAGRVIVVDHLQERLEKARTMAYAETLDYDEHDDVVVELKKQTDYLGADVVIEAVGAEADGNLTQQLTGPKLKLQGGSATALNWAIDGARKGGTVSVVGAYGPIPNAVKFGDALNKGLTLRMNQTPVKRQWPRMFEHVRNGFLTPRQMVTHRFPLEGIPEAYHVFSSKLDGCIKPLILPSAA